MYAILHFILFVIIFVIVAILVIAFTIYRRLHGMARKFQEQMGGFDTRQQSSGARKTASGQQQSRQSQDCDEIIIDERSPEEAERKIFSKDEGEYVDFKEES